jgi:hypothetical protein
MYEIFFASTLSTCPPARAAQARRAGMKVLKAIRLRGGKAFASIRFFNSGCMGLEEQFMNQESFLAQK